MVHLGGAPASTGAAGAKFAGALLGALVGDVLGAPFEGHPGPVPADRLPSAEDPPSSGRYTDDTAMTLALAESILTKGGLDQDHLAATFAAHYRREPFRGYGAGTAEHLARVAAGADWRESAAAQFGGRGSFGNGAAMRVTPVALVAAEDPLEAAELARRSAEVTHTHPAAVEAAAAQAVAVALALAQPSEGPIDPATFLHGVRRAVQGGEIAQALEVVANILPHLPAATAQGVGAELGNGVAATEAVPAALASFLSRSHSFEETVHFAISLGGDTDTIASMAGAISGAYLGGAAIPRAWLEHTENVAAVMELAARFAARLGPPAFDRA